MYSTSQEHYSWQAKFLNSFSFDSFCPSNEMKFFLNGADLLGNGLCFCYVELFTDGSPSTVADFVSGHVDPWLY